jgi:polyphosphate kinase
MEKKFTPKELSWMSFNERVLQEAENENNPVIERLKFLGIYSNNQDEFFRVRVADLKRFSKLGEQGIELLGDDPNYILENIHFRIKTNRKRVDSTLQSIKLKLAENNIFIINETQILKEHSAFLKDFFTKKLRPHLMPILLDEKGKIPDLKDDMVYFAVRFRKPSDDDSVKYRYFALKIPSNRISRFVELPVVGSKKYVMFIDDVIRLKLKTIFKIFETDDIEAFEFKITKDAELDIDENVASSYVDKIHDSLKLRQKGRAVRFVFDQQMPADMLNFLLKKFRRSDVVLSGGRYFNYKDFSRFPTLGLPVYKSLPSIAIKRLDESNNIFSEIAKEDIMLHFPYHSFDYFIDLLREASIDPKVTSIKITLYRIGKHSSVINALVNALRNGKIVIAVFELQARFDEEANIYWSRILQEEGAHVIYGVPGLKVHSKLCLITRKEHRDIEQYACISTGNFNEDTAQYYTDTMLLTNNPEITDDCANIFEFLTRNYKQPTLKSLLVSPFYFRNSLSQLISNETENALQGKEAWIKIKVNNLCDSEIFDLLYSASNAGVKIQLLVRGMFSLWPGIPGLSENIEARALIDRFLEHSRMYSFANNGEPKVFIASADVMLRNLDRRVEATCPIYNKTMANELLDIFSIQWKDNCRNRILDKEMYNHYVTKGNNEVEIRSQHKIHEYLMNKKSNS